MARSFTPFRNGSLVPLEDFYKEVDSLVQNFLEPNDRANKFTPYANLAETESSYELSLDLPGVKPEEVNVEMNDGQLTVSGERRFEQEESGKTFHRIERSYGHFRRVVSIPAPVDESQIKATYQNGVLTVTLPKSDKVKPTKISVTAAE